MFIRQCLSLILTLGTVTFAWQSKIVNIDSSGNLSYKRDAQGNMIPNFSHSGYKTGNVPLPTIPTVKHLPWSKNDDHTSYIQIAINALGKMPLDSKTGYRGALELGPGAYIIKGTLHINITGIVLRGSGDGSDSTQNTVLNGVGDDPHQREIIVAGGGVNNEWKKEIHNTRSNIISDVLVGQYVIHVDQPDLYSVGDNIIIHHPTTEAWLKAVHYGDTNGAPNWTVKTQAPIVFNRYIVQKNGNSLTLDVPVYNTLNRSLSQSYIYKLDRSGILTNIGIEKIRIDIHTKKGDPVDENHAWTAIAFRQAENVFVRDSTVLHFGYAGVFFETVTFATVDNCKAIDPVAVVTGGRMYNFCCGAAQQILVKNSHASNGRHHFVSNGVSYASGLVFYNSTSTGAHAASEGHRHWSVGMLFDTLTMDDHKYTIGLYNRGNMGSSHGWASAHSVAWGIKSGGVVVQQPPTAQNYAIGCSGVVSGKKPPAPFEQPEGYIEGTNRSGLEPISLYKAQLDERLK